MREYEFSFVVQPEISEEGIGGIAERFEGILEKSGSEKLFYEDWGRRRLAYEIRSFQKGHYRVLHFLSDGAVIPELERSARLDDSILRFLTVLADESVADLDARRGEAVKFEEERVQRAAEKAQRDAEEAAREAEEQAQRAAEAERAAEAAKEAAAAEPEASAEADEGGADAGDDASAEAPSGDDATGDAAPEAAAPEAAAPEATESERAE